MPQKSVPCVVYRGGTSRGLFFHKHDLPEDEHIRNKIFFAGIDAYNPTQINGLGSGTSHTSKVVVISPTTIQGADVEYTFYQIGIGKEIVDDKGTCGNLMAAAAAFAIDEGLVKIDSIINHRTVSMFNTNIKKIIRVNVPVSCGEAEAIGDFMMPGVINPGAKFTVDILQPGGGKTGKTLPLGVKRSILIGNQSFDISFIDVVNPFVFISSDSFGMGWNEMRQILNNESDMSELLEEIRAYAAVEVGLVKNLEETKRFPAVPKIAIVSKAESYISNSGEAVQEGDIDLVAIMLSMGKVHKTFAASGLLNLASASLLKGTIPFEVLGNRTLAGNVIRIGHPGGVATIRVSVSNDNKEVTSVGLERTVRRIIKGNLFYTEF